MRLSGRYLGGLLGLLLVVGTGLRFYHLDEKSLWSDELFTVAMAKYYPFLPEEGQPLYRRINVWEIGDGDTFFTAKSADQSPPLNDLLEIATVSWLGTTEFAARLPAALAACALLLWYAGFAWRHPDPAVRRVMLWSLLFLTFYPHLISYAKEGRAYSVGVSILGMAGLLWMLRWRNGWSSWRPPGWLEIGLFTLACHAHYNAALFVALLLLPDAVMAVKERSLKAWLGLLALGSVFLFWIALHAHTILFTSSGKVAWTQKGTGDYILLTLQDAPLALHTYWLVFTAIVLLGLLLVRWRTRQPLWPISDAKILMALCGLTLLYIAGAGLFAAKAGMFNPRYYIFIVPFVAVMMGTVFAQLRQRWSIACAAVVIVALAVPGIQALQSRQNEDFRAMTMFAVRGSDPSTLFLFPWEANRNTYRVYLEKFLGGVDVSSRMVGISLPGEAVQVCERLRESNHIAVIAHHSGRDLIDSVLASCGSQWPQRSRRNFHGTFAEHWIAQ